MVPDLPVSLIVLVPVVPRTQHRQLVVELSMMLELELVVQLVWQLKLSELESVVQLLVDAVVTELRLHQRCVVGWSHGILVELEPGHFRRLSTVASQFGVETGVVDEEAAVAVEL